MQVEFECACFQCDKFNIESHYHCLSHQFYLTNNLMKDNDDNYNDDYNDDEYDDYYDDD